jgi:hypothetical protein
MSFCAKAADEHEAAPMNKRLAIWSAAFAATVSLAMPALAKEDIGIFSGWAVFRDEAPTRCYAIGMPASSRLQRDYEPYATISTYPARKVRGQVHFRVSRQMAPGSAVTLTIGSRRFRLVGQTSNAWAEIVASMRSAKTMVIRAVDSRGRRFSNTYQLQGVATAMDAATVACAKG